MLALLCSIAPLARLLSACAALASGPATAGYVEGEYVLLAPLDVAQIAALPVRRGDRLPANGVAVVMERHDAELAAADADAKLAAAEAELANLRRGRRAEEIAVIEATLNSAEAQARDSDRAYARRADLYARGNTSQSEFDQALTSRDVAHARVKELQANLAVARLPARADEIRAAESRVAQATAAAAQAHWRLDERTLTTPAAGQVADVIRRVGEVAGPNAPVLSFLPDGAVKLKIFLPQALASQAQPGGRLLVSCDGCPAGLTAIISYVAPEPEFTPPVIYSIENRQKLVYLVEARPDGPDAARLAPGQIIDARLAPAATEGGR